MTLAADIESWAHELVKLLQHTFSGALAIVAAQWVVMIEDEETFHIASVELLSEVLQWSPVMLASPPICRLLEALRAVTDTASARRCVEACLFRLNPDDIAWREFSVLTVDDDERNLTHSLALLATRPRQFTSEFGAPGSLEVSRVLDAAVLDLDRSSQWSLTHLFAALRNSLTAPSSLPEPQALAHLPENLVRRLTALHDPHPSCD
jgi:hypothetical protein